MKYTPPEPDPETEIRLRSMRLKYPLAKRLWQIDESNRLMRLAMTAQKTTNAQSTDVPEATTPKDQTGS